VHSGDYSGGSLSSQKKRKAKDIDANDFSVENFKDFQKKNSISTDRPSAPEADTLRKYSIKEENREDDPNPMTMGNISTKSMKRGSLTNNQHHSVKIS